MSAPRAADPVPVRIGTAGWALRKQHASLFPGSGSHLERYARRLNAVEINSSFYRPHRRGTYERWAASVPADFAFSVKVPREITHGRRLADTEMLLDKFLNEAGGLGAKLSVLLVQLPPNFAFDAALAAAFFAAFRDRFAGNIAFEPRHASWFTADSEARLIAYRIARVAADPAVVPAAADPGGWPGLRYFRLHGTPRTYYSTYARERIAQYAAVMKQAKSPTWCIFDNTALGAATENALVLRSTL